MAVMSDLQNPQACFILFLSLPSTISASKAINFAICWRGLSRHLFFFIITHLSDLLCNKTAMPPFQLHRKTEIEVTDEFLEFLASRDE